MQAITAYKTDDGEVFYSEQEAREHEELIARGEEIEKWLTAENFSHKKIPEYRRILVKFLAR